MPSNKPNKQLLIGGAAIVALLLGIVWYVQSGLESSVVPSASVATDRQSSNPERAIADQAAEEATPKSSGNEIPIPHRYRFADVAAIEAVEDEQDLYARYTPDEQERLRGFYRSYGSGPSGAARKYFFTDIFSFHSRAQLEWLVASGFPTPDEVLAAEPMSNEELRDMADSGNYKAAAFLLHREAPAEGRLLKENPGSADNPNTEAFRLAVKNDELERQLLAEPSAFSAYAIAASAAANEESYKVLAAYELANLLGDQRATRFSAHYESSLAQSSRDQSSIDTSAALSSFRGLVFDTFGGRNSPDVRIELHRPRFEMTPANQ